MASNLEVFELIVRSARTFTERGAVAESDLHAFDRRNVHQSLPKKVRRLFDDGHYAEATFEAFKYVDKKVQGFARSSQSGLKLMMAAFNEDNPLIALTPCHNTSEKDEQQGFKFLFSGSILAMRNPRGHECDLVDDIDTCLDHLALASLLLRRLEQAGFI